MVRIANLTEREVRLDAFDKEGHGIFHAKSIQVNNKKDCFSAVFEFTSPSDAFLFMPSRREENPPLSRPPVNHVVVNPLQADYKQDLKKIASLDRQFLFHSIAKTHWRHIRRSLIAVSSRRASQTIRSAIDRQDGKIRQIVKYDIIDELL